MRHKILIATQTAARAVALGILAAGMIGLGGVATLAAACHSTCQCGYEALAVAFDECYTKIKATRQELTLARAANSVLPVLPSLTPPGSDR